MEQKQPNIVHVNIVCCDHCGTVGKTLRKIIVEKEKIYFCPNCYEIAKRKIQQFEQSKRIGEK